MFKIENAVAALTTKKTTEWNQVTRAVLQTEPKCAADVPYMVDWFMKFGGGTSNAFLPWMSAMYDNLTGLVFYI